MENKGEKKKKRGFKDFIYRLIYIVCIIVFLFAGYKVVEGLYGYIKAEMIIEEAQENYVKVVETEEEEEVKTVGPIAVDFEELVAVNDDIVGWIYMEDTIVNYPVLQSTNNKYYLDRTLYEKFLPAGSIFMDYRNSEDFSDAHTIIYGHNMKNHTMFGDMDMFMDYEYLKAHPYVYLYLPSGECYKYEIYSAYTAHVEDGTFGIHHDLDEYYKGFLDISISNSLYSGNVDQAILPTVEDRVLTLSTCTEDSDDYRRFVVHAVFVEDLSAEAEGAENEGVEKTEETQVDEGTDSTDNKKVDNQETE